MTDFIILEDNFFRDFGVWQVENDIHYTLLKSFQKIDNALEYCEKVALGKVDDKQVDDATGYQDF